MPTYEYVCKSCGHAWEVEQRISADPLKECPSCHKLEAQRQISGGNFILKGGGWYADAYSGPTNKTADKPATEAKPSTESKPEAAASSETKSTTTTTEAKPAAAPAKPAAPTKPST
jgi:putative FmdB family regulatory protein